MSAKSRLRGGRAFVDAVVHETSPLSVKARLVAVVLDAYTHPKTGVVAMPAEVIAERTGLSVRSVQRATDELDGQGFVQIRHRRRGGADHTHNEYRMRVPVPFDWSTPPGSPTCGLASRGARRVLLVSEETWQGAAAAMAALYWVDRHGFVGASYQDLASVAGTTRRSAIRWVAESVHLQRVAPSEEWPTGRLRFGLVAWHGPRLGSYWPVGSGDRIVSKW